MNRRALLGLAVVASTANFATFAAAAPQRPKGGRGRPTVKYVLEVQGNQGPTLYGPYDTPEDAERRAPADRAWEVRLLVSPVGLFPGGVAP